MRKTMVAVAGAALMVGAAACSSGSTGSPSSTTTPSTVSSPVPLTSTAFAAPAASGTQPAGVTYNADRVPIGAKATVTGQPRDGGTEVMLTVSGLKPNQMYGAHVHTKACGAQPGDSGPHYQDKKDPVQPSVDPAYANASNEVWLDLMTDANGDAHATSTTKWAFRKGEANAVVIHAEHTHTEAGKAGTAGDRLACVTAAFSS